MRCYCTFNRCRNSFKGIFFFFLSIRLLIIYDSAAYTRRYSNSFRRPLIVPPQPPGRRVRKHTPHNVDDIIFDLFNVFRVSGADGSVGKCGRPCAGRHSSASARNSGCVLAITILCRDISKTERSGRCNYTRRSRSTIDPIGLGARKWKGRWRPVLFVPIVSENIEKHRYCHRRRWLPNYCNNNRGRASRTCCMSDPSRVTRHGGPAVAVCSERCFIFLTRSLKNISL